MRFRAKIYRENPAPDRGKLPMPESELAANLQATALAAMLESARTPHELTVYRGALTPRELDAPEVETAALASGAAHPRSGLDAARGRARGRPIPLAERDGDQHRQRSLSQHRRLEPGAERAGPHPGRPDGVARGRGAFAAAAKPVGREAPGAATACWERRLPANPDWSWRLRPTRSTNCWPT